MIISIFNFTFLFSIFFYLNKKKFIKKDLLIIFFFSLLSVFFINGFFFSEGYMPDQEHYLNLNRDIRNFDFYFMEYYHVKLSDRTFLAAFIQSLIPIPIIHSVLDVSLAQKFLYLCTFLYLHNKKALNQYSFAIFLFLPSIILYTGVALKESLVFSLVVLAFYSSISKNIILSIVLYTILLSIKPQIAIIGFVFNIVYFLIFYLNYSKIIKIILFGFILLLGITVFYMNIEIINLAYNERRVIEATYDLSNSIPDYIDFSNFYSVAGLIIFSFKNFYTNPNIFNAENLFQFIQSIENIAIIVILILNFAYCYSLNKSKALFWLCYLVLGTIMIGGLVFNFGTMTRWKIEIIMYYIFYLNFTCEIKKK